MLEGRGGEEWKKVTVMPGLKIIITDPKSRAPRNINNVAGLGEDIFSSLIDLDFSVRPQSPEPLLDWAEEVNKLVMEEAGVGSLL